MLRCILCFSGVFIDPTILPVLIEERAREEPIEPIRLIAGPMPREAPRALLIERAPADWRLKLPFKLLVVLE